MVRALLDNRKTQTRRLAWQQCYRDDKGAVERVCPGEPAACFYERPSPWQRVQTGDRLWVREHCLTWDGTTRGASYGADHPDGNLPLPAGSGRWSCRIRPSTQMPRWASRLTLVVTDVRRQRLQDISEEDARAEGVRTLYGEPFDSAETISDRRRFELLWNHLHGPGAWHANPEVIALSFEVHRCNVDAMGTEHAPAPAAA